MQINQIDSLINFSAISLSQKERKKAEQTIAVWQNNPGANNDLLRIFDKHLKKEASLKAKKIFSFEDVLQDLYFVFFNSLEQNKNNPCALENIIDDVNKFKPGQEIVLPQYYRKEIIVNNDYKDKFWNKVVAGDLPIYASNASSEEREIYIKELNKLKNNTRLTPRQRKAFELKSKCLTNKEISKIIDCNPVNAAKNVSIALAKIQNRNNVLPAEYEKRAAEIKKILQPDIDINQIIKALINDPNLRVCDLNKVKENADIISKEFNIDCAVYVTACFGKTSTFAANPKTIISNISNVSKSLNIPREKYIEASLKMPQLFYQKSETVISNIEGTAKALNFEQDLYTNAALKVPELFVLKPETISKNVNNSSKVLKLSKEKFITAALKNPNLFYVKLTPEKIKKSAEVLKLSESEFIKIGLLSPTLFLVTPDYLSNQFYLKANAFDVKEEQFRKCIKLEPGIMYRNADSLLENRAEFCELFKITSEEFKKIFLKCPGIITRVPENLFAKTEEGAKLFKVDFQTYKKTVLRYPALLCRDQHTLFNNVKRAAELMNIDLDVYIKSVMAQPVLINMKPETILNNVKQNAELFNKSEDEIIKSALKQPVRFALKAETVKRKADINEFKNRIEGCSAKKDSVITLSDMTLYLKILNYLIGKKYDSSFSSKTDKSETDEFIKSHSSDVIELEIPDMPAADGFVENMEAYSKSIAGKNIFSIKKES